MHLTIDPAIALPNAMPVDLLGEEVGIVNQSRGRAPGDMAVEGRGEAGRRGEHGSGDRPLWRHEMGQVPLRRQGREEVWVVADDWPAGRRALRSDGPVVRRGP